MTTPALSDAQVGAYRREGYLSPVLALTPDEAAAARVNLDALMGRTASLADPATRHKPHLYARWVSDLVRHPRVLDAVEAILGPNLLVWRSVFFVKKPRDPHYVAWHQDSAYWGLSSDDEVTAWIALTESTIANGCLQVVPGSHLQPDVPHAIEFAENNVLVRGQKAVAEIPEDRVRSLELCPGEMSLHHVRMLHGSRGNASDGARVGLAVRYIATSVRQRGLRGSAMLVRGEDAFGNFDAEPEPRGDDDPATLAWHRKSRRLFAVELLHETFIRPFPRNLGMLFRWVANPSRLFRATRTLVWPSAMKKK
ncbi:MAG: phytanoyl-CoA dioxygenase family protein [Thermoanaerobaculia bacterium]